MANQKNAKETQAEIAATESKAATQTTESKVKEQTIGSVSANAKSASKESLYSAEEFVTNAEALFQKKPECVRAALMDKGIKVCTKSEAKQAVEDFMKKEVN